MTRIRSINEKGKGKDNDFKLDSKIDTYANEYDLVKSECVEYEVTNKRERV